MLILGAKFAQTHTHVCLENQIKALEHKWQCSSPPLVYFNCLSKEDQQNYLTFLTDFQHLKIRMSQQNIQDSQLVYLK